MRRRLTTLAVVMALSLPAFAARQITVEQLQELVSGIQISHPSDEALAKQLADARLTKRLTGAALQHMILVCPGPKSAQVLQAIADSSAFLDPPASELPAMPAPDLARQKAIIGMTVNYVVRTLPALPNFLATRSTQHYVDNMQGLEQVSSQSRGSLFLISTYNDPISFRDGKETDDPAVVASLNTSDKKSRPKNSKETTASRAPIGLSSWGEFGPILGLVLVDGAKGKLSWLRWQQEDGKPVAAFQFSVDRSSSHLSLNYCCQTQNNVGLDAVTERPAAVTWKPGYHGNFEVDPETGVILRITIEADPRPEDPIQQAAIMVEYGKVKIGDSALFCPTRSIAVSVAKSEIASHGELESVNRLQLNEVEFVDYHRFGSESTLVLGTPPSSAEPNQSAAEPVIYSAPQAQNSPNNTPSAATPGAIAEATPPAPAADPSAQPTPPPNAPTQVSNVGGEVVAQAMTSLPNLSDNAAKPGNAVAEAEPSGVFTLKVTTRSVDVALVADDRHGKPLADLKQDEIEIYDNGRKQQLADFHHATQGIPQDATAPSPQPPASETDSTSNTFTNSAAASAQFQDAPDLLILLIDESHLAYLDLNRARNEMLRFLAATRPNSPVALYAISERGFRAIQDVTQDHTLAAKKLASWVPDASAVSQAQALQRNSGRRSDPMRNTEDLGGPTTGSATTADTIQTADPMLHLAGNHPLRYALEGMIALARHFAAVPGHKSLAWISGDSVLAGMRDLSGVRAQGEDQLQAALQHTLEALNEAHIGLYIVDASSTNAAAGGFDASVVDPNKQYAPIQNGPTGPRNINPLENSGQIQQDISGIQGPLRQLAESTGGRAINRGSDLKSALDGIGQDSTALYELAFSPDSQADGKFHTLQVKVPTRKNVVLRYRTGYLYSEENASTQQRFQQAVWSPQDATGITLTTEVVPASESASGSTTVKLRIAFPGLALEKQSDRWTDQLYIFVAQRDDGTQKAEVSGDTLRLSLKQASYESGMPAGIPYQRAVEVKSKLGSVRVIVVDGNSGKIGSVTLPSSAFHP